jgi:hypothetical protein
LIERFSEDLGNTVFREDIGQPATIEKLEALSGQKRNACLEAIKDAWQSYIQAPMLERLSEWLQQTLQPANMNAKPARVEPNSADPNGQSLIFWKTRPRARSAMRLFYRWLWLQTALMSSCLLSILGIAARLTRLLLRILREEESVAD